MIGKLIRVRAFPGNQTQKAASRPRLWHSHDCCFPDRARSPVVSQDELSPTSRRGRTVAGRRVTSALRHVRCASVIVYLSAVKVPPALVMSLNTRLPRQRL